MEQESAAEMDLDVTEEAVTLVVKGKYYLKARLGRRVEPDTPKAKFAKATRTLLLRVDLKVNKQMLKMDELE